MTVQLSLFSNIRRPYKGKSLFSDLPSAYVTLSLKTTGLSPMWDSIIELRAARFKNGAEVNRFSSLVRPGPCERSNVDSFTAQRTGISNEMLAEAPAAEKVFKDFAAYLEKDDILIGYNSDINFLYDSFVEHKIPPLSNDFIDLSRQGLVDSQEPAGRQKNPLSGRHCVFTGRLERFPRKEAMRIVAELGGVNEKSVTRRTNVLILGNEEYRRARGGKSRKHRKAEELVLAGQDIEMIPENVFYDMVDLGDRRQ